MNKQPCHIPGYPFIINIRQVDFFRENNRVERENGENCSCQRPSSLWDTNTYWVWDNVRRLRCMHLDTIDRQHSSIYFEVIPKGCENTEVEALGYYILLPFNAVYSYSKLRLRRNPLDKRLDVAERAKTAQEIISEMKPSRWAEMHEHDLVALWYHPKHPIRTQRDIPKKVQDHGSAYFIDFVSSREPWLRGQGKVLGTICTFLRRKGTLGVETEPTEFILIVRDFHYGRTIQEEPLCEWYLPWGGGNTQYFSQQDSKEQSISGQDEKAQVLQFSHYFRKPRTRKASDTSKEPQTN